jgi:putative ABC transport system permease protein
MLGNIIKIGFRVLMRRKFFAAVSLSCISFTLVVLTVLVALLDHAVAPLPPENHLDRTLRLTSVEMSGPDNRTSGNPGYAFLDRYVRTLPGVEAVSILSEQATAVSYVGEQRVECKLKRTDGDFWRILRFRFLEGGPFSAQDDHDANPVAVINAATRHRLLGDGAPAVGQSIDLGGRSFRVVGVVENVPADRAIAFSDIWVPIGTSPSQQYRSEFMHGFQAMVLAKDRRDFPRLKEEFQQRLLRVELPDPQAYDSMRGALLTSYEQLPSELLGARPGESRLGQFIGLLGVGMLLFMLLPTMNLVSINMSRIYERSSEIGVRKAFGASPATLVRQFVLENVLLCLVGGAIGLVVSLFILNWIGHTGLVPYARFTLNVRVFAGALVLAVFFGVLSGVYPAWRMSRLHPVAALQIH